MTQRPRSALIGTGRLAQALAPALHRAGWPVVAIGSRDSARAQGLAAQLPGCAALDAHQAAQAADWVWLCVPDAALAPTAAGLPWRAGQLALHAAGATPLDVLESARAAGAEAAGFHPLQLFAGGPTELAGCGVGIEADSPARLAELQALAHDLDLRPLTLTAGARRLYHAGAHLAASGVLAVLDAALSAWREAGLAEQADLTLLLPLTRGALGAAAARGLPLAVAGPVARGDTEVLAAQLTELGERDSALAQLYAQLACRQLELVERSGRLDERARDALRHLLAAPVAR